MADQIFTVKSGFYDAVNGDRTYKAADMNKPYNRVVADGVFATPEGTPSTDLQVIASGTGMAITVQKGQALVGQRWFENESPIIIIVPTNTAFYSRLDSVIIQVDKRTSGRTGSVIYRTGTAAQTPEAPALTQNNNVMEYRVANILVSPSASAITQSAITDTRGSSECPWVTSLIQQVDTSTLWAQYQEAYQEQFNEFTVEYNEYKQAQRIDWDQFIHDLTEDLTCTMNLVEYTNRVVTDAETPSMSIGITYEPTADILEVYINGLRADAADYTANSTTVTFTNPLDAGQTVLFRVLKSVIGGNISSVMGLVNALAVQVHALEEDSEWQTLTLDNGALVDTEPCKYRKLGNIVEVNGFVTALSGAKTIFTLPAGFRPSTKIRVPSNYSACFLTLDTDGTLKTAGASSSQKYPIHITFIA